MDGRQLSPPLTACELDAPGRELDVVVGLDNVDVELALRRRQEGALLDTDLQERARVRERLHRALETIQEAALRPTSRPKRDREPRTFSTPGPKSSLRVAMMRVFLPAPDGP